MSLEQDKELINALRREDRTALETIFKKYHAQLCLVSFRIVDDVEAAKDTVQEVFIKFWKNRMVMEVNTSLQAYLKRAVVNTSLNYLESKKKLTRLEPKEIHTPYNLEPSVEQRQLTDELLHRAEKAISQLPPRTKAVFLLIRVEEMSYLEAAEAMGISSRAVEKEMMKALKLLRIALKDYLSTLLLFQLARIVLL